MLVGVDVGPRKEAAGDVVLVGDEENLGDVVGDVRAATNNVANGSQEMTSSSETVSQGATE